MTDEQSPQLDRGPSALDHLLRVLSPLGAIGDPTKLAEAVADWILATVADGCRIDVAEDGTIQNVVDRSEAAARPVDPARLSAVIASGRPGSSPPSWQIFPLVRGRQIIGALSVSIAPGTRRRRDEDEVSELGRVANFLATALSEARAYERAAQISKALQESLLPVGLPTVEWLEMAARYLPGTADLDIGGDWYDAQIVDDGTVALSVGDVAGHGVEAAAEMGELRSAMSALRLVRRAPDDLISVLHRLSANLGYMATAICARLDPAGNLVWASAGHLPLLVIRRSGEVEFLFPEQSPPLGTGSSEPVALNRHQLFPGDAVVLYTDGLVERRGEPIDVSLGRLADLIASLRWSTSADLIDQIVSNRDEAGLTGDDIAVLAAYLRRPEQT